MRIIQQLIDKLCGVHAGMLFFFSSRRRHTRCLSAWSSDVCSSDLNTSPGAACDVPSHLYEFSFAPNPHWSRRYAPQAEIQSYLEQVARRHGVLERIRTSTEVTRASWERSRGKWILQTSAGPHEADVLITACGQLSVPKLPPLAGLERFAGPAFHTARWRH